MALDNPSYFQLKQCQNEKKVTERKSKSKSKSKSFFKTFYKNTQEEFMSGQPRRNDIAPKYRNCCQHSPYNIKFINSSKMFHDSNSVKRLVQPLDNNFQQVFGDLSDQNNNNQAHEREISSEEIVLPSVILNKKICSNCIPSNCVKHEPEVISVNTVSDNVIENDTFKISIISSLRSTTISSWINYFKQLFIELEKNDTQFKYQLKCSNIEEEEKDAKQDPIAIPIKSHLQIVIICPKALDFIKSNETTFSWTNRSFTENGLIMFLGLNETDINSIKHLPIGWTKFTVDRDRDENFIRSFVEDIRDIIRKQKTKTFVLKHLDKDEHVRQSESTLNQFHFSLLPKKVKPSSNRVLILLSEPLKKDDSVQVLIEKADHLFAIGHIQRKNPYTIKFTMPDICFTTSMLVSVMIVVNDQLVSTKRQIKCESRLKELESLLNHDNNPIEFMCKALNLSNTTRPELDHWMANNFRRNVPKNFQLVTKENGLSTVANHNEEYPTLLHFASRFGFENLCLQLIECPGSANICQLTNSCGLTPIEMARNAGFHQLAEYLRNFSEMSELNRVYDFLKNISLNTNDNTELLNEKDTCDTCDTCVTSTNKPDHFQSEHYLIPPPARPIETISNEIVDKNDTPFNNYMNFSEHFNQNNLLNENDNDNTGDSSLFQVEARPLQPTAVENHSKTSINPDLISQKSSIQHNMADKYQHELIEILNDFKNDIFSITEVEQLFENWKNRNEVQRSFLEKQQQLNSMRSEYEKIQQLMKSNLRKMNPFEKIKKIFSKSKSCQFNESLSKQFQLKNQQHRRPLSNISVSTDSSLSSSSPSSCERNSLFSRTDDSGTHSDVEDFTKKISHEYIELDGNIQNTYINVPADV